MKCGGPLIEKEGAEVPAAGHKAEQSEDYGVIEEPSKLQFILIGIIIAAACIAASVLSYLRSESLTNAYDSQHIMGYYAFEMTTEDELVTVENGF